MTNHYYLLVRSPETSLSKLMSLLNKRYANYYNTRYGLTGHVFEKRFYDEIVEDRAGMLQVSRYIHLNPVKAKMVERPEWYPWSSYHLYKGNDHNPPPFIDIQHILNFFVGTTEEKRQSYCFSMSQ
jgi:hypothetical protein